MAAINKYGKKWAAGTHPVEIERYCIRQGGRWKDDKGNEFGAGLKQHFKNLETLLWPDDYQNRWTDWMLELLLTERICVFGGSKDSGKTRRVSKWALMDYWCYPDTTLFLMTSTTSRGLELRVWGDIKSLWDRAHERYPELEGNPVDSKKGIFTDAVDEFSAIRDMRKGIIGIPTMTSDRTYDGSALTEFAGIKQARRRLIGDEMQHISCFPAGTLVNCVNRRVSIEHVACGELVWSACGLRVVTAIGSRVVKRLVKVRCCDGRQIICTPEHPFFTNMGWKKACELNESMYIMSAYETMRLLRENIYPTGAGEPMLGMFEKNSTVQILWKGNAQFQEFIKAFLRSELLREVEYGPTRISGEALQSRGWEKNKCLETEMAPGTSRAIESCGSKDERSNTGATDCKETGFVLNDEGYWSSTEGARRKWYRPNQSRVAANENVSGRGLELRNQNREMERKRNTPGVQSRSGIPEHQTGNRSGRIISHPEWQEREGPEEGRILAGSWVDGIEVLEQDDSGFPNSDSDPCGCRVYNLQVEGHPSYSVNGLVVHNCEYLKVLYSMNSGIFTGAFLGNMIADNGKALDAIAEPMDGWGSMGEIKKTTAWRNKYNGMTLNLVGTDSPNLDPETKNRFPGMMTQQAIDFAAALPGGRDSIEWWSQIMGIRKTGVVSDRVMTIELIKNSGGFKDVIWSVSPTLKIYAIDAGYGGDDCIATYIECGTEVGGVEVMAFKEQKVIPVAVSSATTPEDQIANFAKEDCARLGVPDANVFIEAGMRATLAVSFGRIMSPAINAINFGGPATNRPVSNDLFIFDEKTQQKRLKTCYEHYSKFVTELAFSVRGVVESGQARTFPMPAAEEFQKRKWEYVYDDRYELETKLEYKERTSGKSPNYSDSVMIAVEGARRLGFVIERLKGPNSDAIPEYDWLDKEISEQRKFRAKTELTYS